MNMSDLGVLNLVQMNVDMFNRSPFEGTFFWYPKGEICFEVGYCRCGIAEGSTITMDSVRFAGDPNEIIGSELVRIRSIVLGRLVNGGNGDAEAVGCSENEHETETGEGETMPEELTEICDKCKRDLNLAPHAGDCSLHTDRRLDEAEHEIARLRKQVDRMLKLFPQLRE